MGCWNGTCMISNLHVTYGQEVVVYMLAENGRSSDYYNNNFYYDVCPIPFYGEYNDYGAVENCHGTGMNVVVEAIRSQLYEFGQGPNSSHDCEVNKTNLDIDKLFEANHEGRLGIEKTYNFDNDNDDYDARELEKKRLDSGLSESETKELDRLASKLKKIDTFRPVTHVIIHGDIFKAITDKWYIKEYVGEGKGNHGYDKSYVKITFQDVLNDIPGYIEKIKAEDAALETLDPSSLKFSRLMRSMGGGNNDSWKHPNNVVKRMAWMMDRSESRNFSLIDPSSIVEEYRENKDYEGLAPIVKELMVTSWLNSYMSHTRKHWMKMPGGSQNNEADGYIVLADATLDILKAEKVKWGSDEDEELDDEDLDDEDAPSAEEALGGTE